MPRRAAISVVIPTMNPVEGGGFSALLHLLMEQTLPPDEILVVDSSSTDGACELARSLGVRTISIPRAEFDHGATRHNGLLQSCGDIVCFMTQDALPADCFLIERLVAPLSCPDVAAAYARQLACPGLPRRVELVQLYNYPERSAIRAACDISSLGIRAFFFSNVCSAYRRADYLELGGFERPIETNEDMLMCSRILRAGKRAAYVADACVYHSNDLSLAQQFKRDRAIGRFLAAYASELGIGDEVCEGRQMVRVVVGTLLRERRLGETAAFGLRCLVRLAGNRVGRLEGARHSRHARHHLEGDAS